MKKLLLVAAAAATVSFAIPASAQVRHDRHGLSARMYHPHCRMVTERVRVGHRVVVKTRRVCR
jgi:hypothetical protein